VVNSERKRGSIALVPPPGGSIAPTNYVSFIIFWSRFPPLSYINPFSTRNLSHAIGYYVP